MPERISRYSLERKLGQGGMGEVYLARDPTLGRQVALKILPSAFASDPERLGRFTQEAMLASALSHPNVAHIYEMGESGGIWFITMEYVEGQPLSVVLQSGPLPAREVTRIGLQVADVLDAAHSKGIIHRDIKPANLMLDSRGHIKVLDFGLAKRDAHSDPPEETQLVTSTGVVLGTVRYMSPEQALGKPVDHRTDLFSLGLVLYEAATGKPPFAGANPQETIARLLQSQPEPIAPTRPRSSNASSASAWRRTAAAAINRRGTCSPISTPWPRTGPRLRPRRRPRPPPSPSESSWSTMRSWPGACFASIWTPPRAFAFWPNAPTGLKPSRPSPSTSPAWYSSMSRCPSSTASRCWS